MARPSTYSAEDKARVQVALQANDGNVKRTARQTQVPEQTVRNWKQEWERKGTSVEISAALPAIQDDFIQEAIDLRAKAAALLGMKLDAGEAKVGELNAVIGTLTEKILLLSGAATSRTESINTGPSPEEFGRALAGFLDAAVTAQEQRNAEIIEAEYEEQPEPEAQLPPAHGLFDSGF